MNPPVPFWTTLGVLLKHNPTFVPRFLAARAWRLVKR